MKNILKKSIALGMGICLAASLAIISLAGEWKQDDKGKWYAEDDGSYPKHTWKEINGAWYCFDSDGYIMQYARCSGYDLGTDGTWTPESNAVNGDEIASVIVEDMGLTFGALKAKYGECSTDCMQKILLLKSGALYEYEDTNLSDIDLEFIKVLINDSISKGAKYGKTVLFLNSPIKVKETDEYEKVKNEYIPNYSFLTDSEGNIDDNSKPIAITIRAKTMFPELTPIYKMEEMVNKAKEMGAVNIDWKEEIQELNSEWKQANGRSYYMSSIRFKIGDCLFYGDGRMCPNVGLDSLIMITRED